uniref:Uncharacterized protein n=1 Tax=Arundo donax TaxID=35708 RepID=A0A0A9G8J4_ARUDO
MEWGELGIR